MPAATGNVDHARRFAFSEERHERARHTQGAERICLECLSQELVADLQNSIVSINNDPRVIDEHIQVISSFGKLARGSSDACILCDIDLQKGRFPAFLRDLIRRFATGVLITRADEDVKFLSRELTRDFIANSLIRPCD